MTQWRHMVILSPSNCLNQSWLIIKGVLRHLSESNFTRNIHELNLWHGGGYYTFEIIDTSPRVNLIAEFFGLTISTPFLHCLKIDAWNVTLGNVRNANGIASSPTWCDSRFGLLIKTLCDSSLNCRILFRFSMPQRLLPSISIWRMSYGTFKLSNLKQLTWALNYVYVV